MLKQSLFVPDDEWACVLCRHIEDYGEEWLLGFKKIKEWVADFMYHGEDLMISCRELHETIIPELQSLVCKRVFIVLDHESMTILHVPELSYESDSPSYQSIDMDSAIFLKNRLLKYGVEVYGIQWGKRIEINPESSQDWWAPSFPYAIAA